MFRTDTDRIRFLLKTETELRAFLADNVPGAIRSYLLAYRRAGSPCPLAHSCRALTNSCHFCHSDSVAGQICLVHS